ncbi:hypothetical protein ABTX81_34990 [Kitasatospora sp. NPDC097605]|uniref:hypothetical protein n=1 Tax=Kitasatospora sp. NPDC097605 TaxID=3157226 RepID=UPI003326F6FA
MSFHGLWCLLPVRADTVERYAPELLPAIEAEAASAESAALLRRWRAAGSTEEIRDDLVGSAAPAALDTLIHRVYEAWEHGRVDALPRLVVSARKGYPAAALAYALGPERFAALPGWFGDLVLSPEEVRRTLPAVGCAFTWTARERHEAALRLAAALRDESDPADIDALLDGVPPVWRAAADAGLGLLGAHFLP